MGWSVRSLLLFARYPIDIIWEIWELRYFRACKAQRHMRAITFKLNGAASCLVWFCLLHYECHVHAENSFSTNVAVIIFRVHFPIVFKFSSLNNFHAHTHARKPAQFGVRLASPQRPRSWSAAWRGALAFRVKYNANKRAHFHAGPPRSRF